MFAEHYAWWFLAGAIVFELSGTLSMKLAHGFTQFWPSLLIFVCYGLSMASLTFALKGIELGMAYAIWAGLGTSLVAVVGVLFFHESANPLKLACVLLIVIGVVGLKWVDSQGASRWMPARAARPSLSPTVAGHFWQVCPSRPAQLA